MTSRIASALGHHLIECRRSLPLRPHGPTFSPTADPGARGRPISEPIGTLRAIPTALLASRSGGETPPLRCAQALSRSDFSLSSPAHRSPFAEGCAPAQDVSGR
jgi:hypothetical protein